MSLYGEIEVCTDVARRYGEVIAEAVSGSSSQPFRLAVSGSTSGAACQRALTNSGIDFSRVELLYVDERCVPENSPERNANTIRGASGNYYGLFGSVHEMDCSAGADAYEEFFVGQPPLDAMQLGCGPDGHTASLFPESRGLSVRDRAVIMNDDPLGHNPHERMTLTFESIARARLAVITVSGEDKAPALSAVLSGEELPVAMVRAERVLWLIETSLAGAVGL
jgi:6-phosphogluconolactonase